MQADYKSSDLFNAADVLVIGRSLQKTPKWNLLISVNSKKVL